MKALVLSATWEPKPGYVVSDFEQKTGKAVTGNSVWRYPKLEVKEVAKPVPAPDQVLLKVKACGVCGSDIHFYETDQDGYVMYPGLTKFPCITGHEFSGQVVAVGSAVSDFQVGDMVTAEEMIWCGYCRPCRDGFPNQCLNLEEIGFTIPGAFAEYLAVGAKYCWKLNAIMDLYHDETKVYEAGALVEPTCVAYNGIFECAGGFKPGGYVAVYGAGPIGLAAIALSKAAGAAKIMAFEVSPQRRQLALTVGADFAFDPRQVSAGDQIMELTNGEGVDMSVEAAGAPTKIIPEMEKSMAIAGKVVQIGRAAERVPVYLEHFQTHKAHIAGAQGHSGYGIFPNVIRLMASGRIDMTRIITARYDLDGVVQAIKQSGERRDGKIMVKV
jgi:threonine dehydrogenase-like Zn-dependent dehydrogenase